MKIDKRIKEILVAGLIFGLIFGLIYGLAYGLIAGIFAALTFGGSCILTWLLIIIFKGKKGKVEK